MSKDTTGPAPLKPEDLLDITPEEAPRRTWEEIERMSDRETVGFLMSRTPTLDQFITAIRRSFAGRHYTNLQTLTLDFLAGDDPRLVPRIAKALWVAGTFIIGMAHTPADEHGSKVAPFQSAASLPMDGLVPDEEEENLTDVLFDPDKRKGKWLKAIASALREWWRLIEYTRITDQGAVAQPHGLSDTVKALSRIWRWRIYPIPKTEGRNWKELDGEELDLDGKTLGNAAEQWRQIFRDLVVIVPRTLFRNYLKVKLVAGVDPRIENMLVRWIAEMDMRIMNWPVLDHQDAPESFGDLFRVAPKTNRYDSDYVWGIRDPKKSRDLPDMYGKRAWWTHTKRDELNGKRVTVQGIVDLVLDAKMNGVTKDVEVLLDKMMYFAQFLEMMSGRGTFRPIEEVRADWTRADEAYTKVKDRGAQLERDIEAGFEAIREEIVSERLGPKPKGKQSDAAKAARKAARSAIVVTDDEAYAWIREARAAAKPKRVPQGKRKSKPEPDKKAKTVKLPKRIQRWDDLRDQARVAECELFRAKWDRKTATAQLRRMMQILDECGGDLAEARKQERYYEWSPASPYNWHAIGMVLLACVHHKGEEPFFGFKLDLETVYKLLARMWGAILKRSNLHFMSRFENNVMLRTTKESDTEGRLEVPGDFQRSEDDPKAPWLLACKGTELPDVEKDARGRGALGSIVGSSRRVGRYSVTLCFRPAESRKMSRKRFAMWHRAMGAAWRICERIWRGQLIAEVDLSVDNCSDGFDLGVFALDEKTYPGDPVFVPAGGKDDAHHVLVGGSQKVDVSEEMRSVLPWEEVIVPLFRLLAGNYLNPNFGVEVMSTLNALVACAADDPTDPTEAQEARKRLVATLVELVEEADKVQVKTTSVPRRQLLKLVA